MTEKDLLTKFGITIFTFEDDLFENEAFYIPKLKTIFLSDAIPPQERVKVALHELGHKDHQPYLYPSSREKHELQANRFMIRHLLIQALDELDDDKDFNYIGFMKHHNLKTMTDEIMVREEYRKLVG